MFGIRDIDIWFPAEASQYIGIWESAPCRVTFFHYFCTWNERTKTHTGIQCGGAAADPARGLCGQNCIPIPMSTIVTSRRTMQIPRRRLLWTTVRFAISISSRISILPTGSSTVSSVCWKPFFRPECYDPAIVAISGSQLRAPPAIG